MHIICIQTEIKYRYHLQNTIFKAQDPTISPVKLYTLRKFWRISLYVTDATTALVLQSCLKRDK